MRTLLLLVLCITLWNLNWVSTSNVADRVKGKPEKIYERIRKLASNKKVALRVAQQDQQDQIRQSKDCVEQYGLCWESGECCQPIPHLGWIYGTCLWAGPAGRGYCSP